MIYNYAESQYNTDFRFYKFPQILLTDPQFGQISNDAKLLFTLMLDRTSLSIKNHWYDKQGKLFIYYTVKETETMLWCSHNKVEKMYHELESVGLIQRKRQGQGKPTKFYIKCCIKIEPLEVPK